MTSEMEEVPKLKSCFFLKNFMRDKDFVCITGVMQTVYAIQKIYANLREKKPVGIKTSFRNPNFTSF